MHQRYYIKRRMVPYLLFSTFLAVTLGAAAPPAMGEPHEPQINVGPHEPVSAQVRVVKKPVYSSKMRLLFAVGLEGTGHHTLFTAIDNLFTANPDLVRMDECEMFAPYYLVDAMAGSALQYNNSIGDARREMRTLAEKGQGLSFPGSVATVQGGFIMHPKKCVGLAGMLSYPTHNGAEKVQQYMDLRELAEVAEAQGVDLRVVYLQRAAKSIIRSTTVHRHFQE